MNIKDILNSYLNPVSIHCSTELEANYVLEIAEKNSIRWAEGQLATSVNYYGEFKAQTCFLFKNGKVFYGSFASHNKSGYTIIKAQEFMDSNASILSIKHKT